MLWVISCTAKPNIDAVRRSASAAHKQYLDAKLQEGSLVLTGTALDLDGKTRSGSLFIVNVKTSAEARAFYEAEPFARAGVFESVTITGVMKSRWNPAAADTAEGAGQTPASLRPKSTTTASSPHTR